MKYICVLILLIQLLQAKEECPFGFDKLFGSKQEEVNLTQPLSDSQDNLKNQIDKLVYPPVIQQSICSKSKVFIDGECQTNDLEQLSSFKKIDSLCTVYWELNDNILIFMVENHSLSWTGLDFSGQDDGQMNDYVIAQILDNNVLQLDSSKQRFKTQLLGYEITNNSVTFKGRRKYEQNDQQILKKWKFISPNQNRQDRIMKADNIYSQELNIDLFDIKQISVCKKGLAYINGKCLTNDLTPLSSKGEIQKNMYEMQWEISEDQKYITFLLILQQQSYVSIGFGYSMMDVDMIIAQSTKKILDEPIMEVYEGLSIGQFGPPAYEEQSQLQLLGYSVSDNYTAVKFKREMRPEQSGSEEPKKLIANKIQNMNAAYSAYNSLNCDYHAENFFNFNAKFSNNQDDLIFGLTYGFMQWHQMFFFITWGVLIDVAMVFARNFKILKVYLYLHGIILTLIQIGTVIMFSMTMYYNRKVLNDVPSGFNGCHYVTALIFFGLFVFTNIFGMIIQLFPKTPKKGARDTTLVLKKIHKYLGLLVYLLGKLDVVTGLNWSGARNDGYILIICTVLFRGIMEFLHQFLPKWYLDLFFPGDSLQMRTNVENQKLLQLLRIGTSFDKIQQTLPGVKYVIACNQVCRIENFYHPGGNYLLEKMNGRDVDCFLFGNYSPENYKVDSYNHSKIAYQWVKNNSIGTLYNEQDNCIHFDEYEELKQNKFADEKNINLIESQIEQILVETKSHKYLKDEDKELYQCNLTGILSNKKIVCQDIYQYDFQVMSRAELLDIKNQLYGVQWMGKHFSLNSKEKPNKKRNYTTVLCMTEENTKYRQNLIELYGQNFVNYNTMNAEENNNNLLPFVIKDYNREKGFSNYINKREDQKQYTIQGPSGPGLQLNNGSKGLHVIVAGGTGILPFLDLLDFMLKKILFNKAVEMKGQEYARQNIDTHKLGLEQNLNGFQLKVYATFKNPEEMLGKDILLPLAKLGQNAELPVDICLRFSDKSDIDNVRCIQQRFDEQLFEKELSQKDSLEKIWICGPLSMQKMMPPIFKKQTNKRKIQLI